MKIRELIIDTKIVEFGECFALISIKKQTWRGKRFNGNVCNEFIASNGLKLISNDSPDWNPSIKALFVRGWAKNKQNDNKILIIRTRKEFDAICKAVGDYNQYWSKKARGAI